jgi:hypothetical protein
MTLKNCHSVHGERSTTERFLSSLEMTKKGDISATCEVSATTITLQCSRILILILVPRSADQIDHVPQQLQAIVSEVHEITGCNRSGARADPRQDNADKHQ